MFKKLTVSLILLLIIISQAYGIESERSGIIDFLQNKTSPEVQRKLLAVVSKNNNASSWLVDHEEVIYSLSIVNVRRDRDQHMQNSLNNAALRTASMRAAANLAIYLDEGKTHIQKFENKNTAYNVLRVHYESKIRFNSSSKIINNKAFSLVWSQKVNAPMSEKEFNENYCSQLYSQAQDLFTAERFPEALKAFQEIHYKQWANIDAYIGASVCLLQMNQKDYAAKLISELLNSFIDRMTPDEAASSARILFRTGHKDEGFKALEQAYNMLKIKSGR